ncbi:MAG: hypothetical protein GU356_00365 [Pyrobaculum sp.]|jgi:hypothetical protein|nr:hypothetical protein [Pyrobaculum sp.]
MVWRSIPVGDMRGVVLLLVVLSVVAYAQSATPNFTRWVDVSIYNFTALVDVAKPDFVMDVDGCSVYVYVVKDFETAKTPLLHTDVPKTSMPASPMDSKEMLDAFIKALGPRLKGRVEIYKPGDGLPEKRTVEVDIHNSTELIRALEKALGMPVLRSYPEALNTVNKTKKPATQLISILKEEKDARASFVFSENVIMISSSSGEKAFEILSRIREAAGGRTPPALIAITPYWTDEEEERRLVNAAMTLERELGTVREFPDGVEGIIHVMTFNRIGPYMLVFPYPNGTSPPDRATAEKVVRRFVELAGVCRSPMVAEFWPKTGFKRLTERRDQTPLLLAAATGAATIVPIAAMFILKRRSTN